MPHLIGVGEESSCADSPARKYTAWGFHHRKRMLRMLNVEDIAELL